MKTSLIPFSTAFKSLLIAGLAGVCLQSQALSTLGVDWLQRSPLPTSETMTGVATDGDVLGAATTIVAVGTRGTILTATNVNGPWTVRNSGTLANLNAVAFNAANSDPGTHGTDFVIVGDQGVVLTSTDHGVTWTPPTPALSGLGTENLTAITWTGNRFFAAGNSPTGAVLYETFDATPTTPPTGTNRIWTKYASAPSLKFHAVGGTTSYIVAAADAKFVKSAIPATGTGILSDFLFPKNELNVAETHIQSVIYTNGATAPRFVSSGLEVYGSTDAKTWSPLPSTPAANLTLTWNLGLNNKEIVGVGADGAVWTSALGTSWTALPQVEPGLQLHAGVKFGASDYVVVGDGGRIYGYSGSTGVWASGYSAGPIDDLKAVGVDAGVIVAVAKNACFVSSVSSNGLSWTRSATTLDATSVVGVGTAGFVATGNGIWTATREDPTTWTPVQDSTMLGGRLNRVIALDNGAAIAVGGTSATAPLGLIYQYDGTNWTGTTVAKTKELRSVVVTPTLTVAVGDGGIVLTSANRTLWTPHTVALTTGEGFLDVIYTGTQFMASTSLGGVWTSTDGIVWAKKLASAKGAVGRLIGTTVNSSTQYLGIGGPGVCLRSFSGGYWFEINVGTSQMLADAVWTGTRLVAVGARGTIFTSEGSVPGRPTVSFAQASSTVLESAGTDVINVQLSPASPLPVTVTYSATTSTKISTTLATLGTTGTADYGLAAPLSITFNPFETSKNITATIRQDVVDESDETATLTLGSPTGDAILGTPSTHVITIRDDDTKPYITALTDQPQNVLLNVGKPLTITANGGGTAVLTGTWKKNNVAIKGATLTTAPNTTVTPATTTYTCAYPLATTALAGAYTLTLVNPSGTLVSSPAQVGVVDDSSNGTSQVVAEKGLATLTVTAVGSNLSYQWRRYNGGSTPANAVDVVDDTTTAKRIVGSQTAKLTIKMLKAPVTTPVADAGDQDTYFCVVTQKVLPSVTQQGSTLSVNGGTKTLYVVNTKPTVQSVTLPPVNKVVGESLDITMSADSHPYKWSYTGVLPTGLTFNTATGEITGRSLKTGPVNLMVTASNVIGGGVSFPVSFTIDNLPAGVVGTYMALVSRNSTQNLYLGGRLDLTVLSDTTFTGKLTYGSVSTSIIGAFHYTAAPADPQSPPVGYVNPGPTIDLTIPVHPLGFTGLPDVILKMQIYPHAAPATADTLAVTLTNATLSSNSLQFSGWRNDWLSETPGNVTGMYNVAMNLDNGDGNGGVLPEIPSGYTVATFTIDSLGKLTVASILSDGTTYSSSGFYNPQTKQVPLYAGVYGNTGSVTGFLNIVQDPASNFAYNTVTTPPRPSTAQPTWTKAPQAAGKTRLYAAGFDYTVQFFSLQSSGKYVAPAAPTATDPGGIIMGFATVNNGLNTNGDNNAQMFFTWGGVNHWDTTALKQVWDVSLIPDVTPFTVVTRTAPPASKVAMPPVTNSNNEANATLTFTSMATGAFNGTFTLSDLNPLQPVGHQRPVIRTGVFSGLIIGHPTNRPGDAGSAKGYGSFTLPDMPSITTPSATISPIEAGQVRLNRAY